MPGSGCSGNGLTTSENGWSVNQVTPLSVDLRPGERTNAQQRQKNTSKSDKQAEENAQIKDG
jgi:hypothetical protein